MVSLLERYLKGLQIEDHVKKKPKKLSGGTKRKLSYCLSIIGSPTIALLDEPSTGMDITSKRFLWNTLLATFKGEKIQYCLSSQRDFREVKII